MRLFMEKKSGKCHICGYEGLLSFEHVPPRSAYNNKTVLRETLEDLLKNQIPPDEIGNYRIQQGGYGDYTLCESCNNKTGSWYGSDYVNFSHLGMLALQQAYKPEFLFNTGLFHPLRIIKQVVTIFFSINTPGLASANPDLVNFVMNRERKYIQKDIFISMYMSLGGRGRFFPLSARGSNNGVDIISEFSFPPFGFVFSFKRKPLVSRLFGINFFSHFEYNEQANFFLPLYVLATFSHFPLDYRTIEQMNADRLKGILDHYQKKSKSS